MPQTQTERPAIQPRRMDFPFDDSIPKRWLADNAVATHVANGVCLLFPAGERYFIRSVRHYQDRIDDPELRKQIKGFFGQEGRHAHEHERMFAVLEAQGYRIRPFLQRYERFAYGVVERLMPPAMNLAGTAAAEHFTAIMADNALRDGPLDQAHPVVRQLLLWHACEEIEHKAVAFDVLQKVNPSYALRVAGLAMASIMLASFWAAGTRMLLEQDGVSGKNARRELKRLGGDNPIGKKVFLRGIREYLRRDFHPWDNDNLRLAQAYLESVGQQIGA
jgi:hypothetical protein